MSDKKAKRNNVLITIFNPSILRSGIFGRNARITWKNDKAGSIVKRDARGRFCSQPFIVAGR